MRPLYAALPFDDQLKALEPGKILKDGRAMRKCVIATNIAETSVTIPGIVYVVDSGFVKVGCRGDTQTHHRPLAVGVLVVDMLCGRGVVVGCQMPVYDPISGLDSLVTQPISQAQATQRCGRAGRVRPGKCFRLYSEEAFNGLRVWSDVMSSCRL